MTHLLSDHLTAWLRPAPGAVAGIMPPGSGASAALPPVVVNGQPLDDEVRQALQQRFGAVAPGPCRPAPGGGTPYDFVFGAPDSPDTNC